MQIIPIIQPTETNLTNFTSPDSQAVGKTEKISIETKEFPQKPKGEQSEDFKSLQSALAEHDISLSFSRDNMTDELVVKIVDGKTGEALQQFPSEVSLKLAATFAKLQGQFVDEQY